MFLLYICVCVLCVDRDSPVVSLFLLFPFWSLHKFVCVRGVLYICRNVVCPKIFIKSNSVRSSVVLDPISINVMDKSSSWLLLGKSYRFGTIKYLLRTFCRYSHYVMFWMFLVFYFMFLKCREHSLIYHFANIGVFLLNNLSEHSEIIVVFKHF